MGFVPIQKGPRGLQTQSLVGSAESQTPGDMPFLGQVWKTNNFPLNCTMSLEFWVRDACPGLFSSLVIDNQYIITVIHLYFLHKHMGKSKVILTVL